MTTAYTHRFSDAIAYVDEDGTTGIMNIVYGATPGLKITGNGTCQHPLTAVVEPGWTLTKNEPGTTTVPDLDIDKVLHPKGVFARGKFERRIVANLIAHVEAAGFELHSVNDGDEITPVSTMKEAMELIFNFDEASLRFWKPDGKTKGRSQRALMADPWHGILLVLDNGADIVSDWNYYADDHDGFNAAMDKFDAKKFA